MLASTTPHSLGDQARGLRALLRQRSGRPVAGQGRSLAVTSGKGGVGKSVLTLNLAVAMAELGSKVCLIDGHPGLGNLDLLCGRNGYWNLSHVVTGSRRVEQVAIEGPAGVTLLPAASSLLDLNDCPDAVRYQLLCELESFTSQFDVLLIDTGSGMHEGVRRLAQVVDELLVVTTPDPLAVAEAYATLKSLPTATVHVAVNQANRDQATHILERLQQTAHTFLRKTLTLGAAIPVDPVVPQSLRDRIPFVMTAPESAAGKAVRQLARQVLAMEPRRTNGNYFERLMKSV